LLLDEFRHSVGPLVFGDFGLEQRLVMLVRGNFTAQIHIAPEKINGAVVRNLKQERCEFCARFIPRARCDEMRPHLLEQIGGGTGIAPLLSILRHLIENDIPRDMRLFWGVSSEQDLYAQARLEALSGRAASLSYTPVLSEPTSPWPGLTGWVHEAALNGIGDLEAVDVYAAGPPAMIAAIQREYAARGSATTRLFFDSFDYAPDTLERQWTSAATKS